MMEINEKLLRQIIEDVLAEMQTSDKKSRLAPNLAVPQNLQ